MRDVRFEDCDFASATWERPTLHRTEFVRCRFTGFAAPDALFEDVRFRHCSAKLAHFRFSRFKHTRFEDCDFEEADFQGADLTGVRFVRCNLSRAQFSHTKLKGADLRTSQLEGLRVGPDELPGAIVDHFQAAYLASLLGLDIRDEYDD